MRRRAPRSTLLRKCINPLWYFHPQAAKYRGLCEADAASAEAYGGLDAAVATAYAGDMERFSLHIPGVGSSFLRLPCAGRPRCGLPAASLGSTASVVRAKRFRRKMQRCLAFFDRVCYTVCGTLKMRPFPVCCNRRFGNGRFLLHTVFAICVWHMISSFFLDCGSICPVHGFRLQILVPL